MRYSTDNLASFIPHTTGYYRIYISDYHGPILGSPFYVLIYTNIETPEEHGLEFVESSGIRDSIRNQESIFVIRSSELDIDVQIKSNEFIKEKIFSALLNSSANLFYFFKVQTTTSCI